MSVSTPPFRSFLQNQLLRLEDWTIRQHLRRTEQRLRHKSHPELSPRQREARRQNLDFLRAYWQAGQFPRNHVEKHQRTPVFIDEYDTHCAVGHLIAQSGYSQTARLIAEQANTALLPEMDFIELDTWVHECGLTPRELATIQPSYCPSGDYEVPQAIIYTAGHMWRWAFLVGLVGVPFAALNIISIWKREDIQKFVPIVGFISGLIVLILGLGLLNLIASDQAEMISYVEQLHTNSLKVSTAVPQLIGVFVITIAGYQFFNLDEENPSRKILLRLFVFIFAFVLLAILGWVILQESINQIFEDVLYRGNCMWLFNGYKRIVYSATYNHAYFAIGLGIVYMLLSSSAYLRGYKLTESPISLSDESSPLD